MAFEVPAHAHPLSEVGTAAGALRYAGGHRWRLAVCAVAVAALLIRVGLIVAAPHFQLTGDPSDYEAHAAQIATGHGYPTTQFASPGTPSAYRPPAYPYLLGGVYAVVGVHPNAARLLGAGLGVLTVVLIAWLGAALWSRRVGLVAGVIAAVCPSLIALNSTLLSETLFLPVEVALALAILKLRQGPPTTREAGLLGALCGLAALTRTVGILLLVPALVGAGSAATDRWRRVRASATVLGCCIAVLLPWTIRNANAFGAFVPFNTQGGFTLVGQYNPESARNDKFQAVVRVPTQIPALANTLDRLYRRPGGVNEAQLDAALRREAFRYIADHPSEVAIAAGLDTLRMFDLGKNHGFTTAQAYSELNIAPSLWRLTTIVTQVITLLAIFAVIARLGGQIRRLGPLAVWSVPLLTLLVTILVGGNPRYRLPADPFLILLAALMLVELGRRPRPSVPLIGRRWQRRRAR